MGTLELWAVSRKDLSKTRLPVHKYLLEHFKIPVSFCCFLLLLVFLNLLSQLSKNKECSFVIFRLLLKCNLSCFPKCIRRFIRVAFGDLTPCRPPLGGGRAHWFWQRARRAALALLLGERLGSVLKAQIAISPRRIRRSRPAGVEGPEADPAAILFWLCSQPGSEKLNCPVPMC